MDPRPNKVTRTDEMHRQRTLAPAAVLSRPRVPAIMGPSLFQDAICQNVLVIRGDFERGQEGKTIFLDGRL